MDGQISRVGLLDEEDILLDGAALELAAADHPGIDLAPYYEVIDAMAQRLRDVGADAATASERAARLAQVFAQDFSFAGDRDTYDDPDNADLIRVIDRRRGLPVSLSILYVAVARRLGWGADPLDVPGHVLVLIADDHSPVIIDPFRQGMIVDAPSLASLINAATDGETPAARHLAKMPNRAVLLRLLLNQATRAEASGKGRRALILYERMTCFAPEYPNAWWHRARLETTDGNIAAGRRSLSAMLEITRDPALRNQVINTLAALADG